MRYVVRTLTPGCTGRPGPSGRSSSPGRAAPARPPCCGTPSRRRRITCSRIPTRSPRFRADPQGFLDGVTLPAILDEIQHVPEVLAFIRARIDRRPAEKGRWLLTGSQEAPLMNGVTESMAGPRRRAPAPPFSTGESRKVSLLRGGFPEVLARPGRRGTLVPLLSPDLPRAGRPRDHGHPGPGDVPAVSVARREPVRADSSTGRSLPRRWA